VAHAVVTLENFSQSPIAVRLAISGLVPALSATAYLPLALARRLMLPSALLMTVNS